MSQSSSTRSMSLMCFITITVALFLLLVTTTHARILDQNQQISFPEQFSIPQNAYPDHEQEQERSFASQFLIPHNAARSKVRVPPLVWSAKLTRYAQWYANQRSNDCALEHSNGRYGENLFWGGGAGWTPAQAVKLWAEEEQYYDYNLNSCDEGQMCGHYTQIVWNNTRKVGCASVACSGDQGTFITCNYHPPGNYIGERPY
ncbi:pathogenesis-related protein PR-1-like [Gastrolobium bilobum]|uniref:pathogenesis-related protein PR-1-like n=1 Tax=Gastrolobium bilobum TaxID=150636 RepID=UPI002AB1FF35|nr:pathogenesis-related protein PR-1-like [Gastrolobium bilobum]